MPKDAPRPIELPDDVWQRPDVLDLCRNHDADGLFRLARRHGNTLDSIGYWTGIDPGEISKRIAGTKGPIRALDRWQRIADGFDMPDEARHAVGLAPVSKNAGTTVIHDSGGTEPHLIDVDLRVAAEESARFGEWADAANSGRLSVEQLTADLRRLAELYLSGPPVPVFLGARSIRNRAEQLLHSHSTPGRSRDLYVVAGYACTLLAWISGDLGQPAAADTHGRTAWLCAELADAPELKSWVLATRSKTAFWDHRLADALAFATAGQQHAPRASVAVLLAAQEADAAAMMGRSSDTVKALASAESQQDRIADDDAIGGLFSCSSARLNNYAAASYLRIGRPADALSEVDRAFGEYRAGSPQAYGTVMQVHVSRALGHLSSGDLDGAAVALQSVVGAPPERHLATVATRLEEVRAALTTPRFQGSREAGSMREAITAFREQSAALALPPAYQETAP